MTKPRGDYTLLLLALALNPIRVPADFPTIEEVIDAAESRSLDPVNFASLD